MRAPLLEVRGLRKQFGALVVTDDVSLEVRAGEIHAIIGPNGAGKSCLIGQITGELGQDAGSISFNGQPIDSLGVHQRAQAGLARAYQVPQLFASFDVHGNVAIPVIARKRMAWNWFRPAADEASLQQAASAALERLHMGDIAQQQAPLLGHGQKRELELAMGFATEPVLLLLDEPLAGMGPGEAERIVSLLNELKSHYGVLLVEHDMNAVFRLADRISVLVAGRIIASGTPAEIRDNPAVRSAYLGDA